MSLSLSSNETCVDSLPTEIIEGFLKYLPIDVMLVEIGLASRTSFAQSIFNSVAFARTHFRFQFKSSVTSDCPIWEYLDEYRIKDELWRSLPLSYQTAIYGDILTANDYSGTARFVADASTNLMWSFRWNLSPKRAYKMILNLLDMGLDPTVQYNRAIRWASRNGWFDVVKHLLSLPNVDPTADLNAAIGNAAEFGHIDVVRLLMADPHVDPSDEDGYALYKSCEDGYLRVASLLLQDKRVTPAANNNYAIRYSAENGHTEVVKLLLRDSRTDPSADNNYAICLAAELGHLDVLEALIIDSRVDPTARRNSPLGLASQNGHLLAVQRLLQDDRIDPNDDNYWAVRIAVRKGHLQIIQCLWEDKRLQKTNRLKSELISSAPNDSIKNILSDH